MNSQLYDEMLSKMAENDTAPNAKEQNALSKILNNITSTVGTVTRDNKKTTNDIDAILGNIAKKKEKGTVTNDDREMAQLLIDAKGTIKRDQDALKVETLIQSAATNKNLNNTTKQKVTQKIKQAGQEREDQIRNMFKMKRKVETVDICFLIDFTGSMHPYRKYCV